MTGNPPPVRLCACGCGMVLVRSAKDNERQFARRVAFSRACAARLRKTHSKHKKVTFRSISTMRVSKAIVRAASVANQNATRVLPMTRGECPELRPCPYVSCRFNLAIEVSAKTGTIKLTYGSDDIDDWPEKNCVLDWAEHGGMDPAEIGKALALTHERARQVEEQALRKLANSAWARRMLKGLLGGDE